MPDSRALKVILELCWGVLSPIVGPECLQLSTSSIFHFSSPVPETAWEDRPNSSECDYPECEKYSAPPTDIFSHESDDINISDSDVVVVLALKGSSLQCTVHKLLLVTRCCSWVDSPTPSSLTSGESVHSGVQSVNATATTSRDE